MPANISDVDAFTATVQGIADGEPLNKAYLTDLAAQHLANRTRYLYNRLPGGAGGTVAVPLNACDSSQIAFDSGPGHMTYRNATTTQGYVIIPLPNQFGAKLVSVTMWIAGASGLGSLPSTMPVLTVISSPTTGVGFTDVATATDTTAVLANYKVGHAVTATLAVPSPFEDEHLFARIDDDDGATAGWKLWGLTMTVSA